MGVGILASLLGWNLTHQTPPPKVGAPAPAFSLHRLTGDGDLSLRSFRGKTVVLNFFASWCGPCKREAPVLEQLWRNDRSDHLVVLGVDTGPDAAGDGRRFVKAHGITYPVVFDPNANVASSRYAASNLPVTYVIYSDEGHGFARPENRLSFFAVAEAFLKQHLGGRSEPVNDDFKNSTIKIEAGAEQIQGLKEQST